jgi:hypothetical protein
VGRACVVTLQATPELVAERVRAVVTKHQSGPVRALALRSEPLWTAGDIVVDGLHVRVVPCHSPLAVRAALANLDDDGAGDHSILVVLCDLGDADLGQDVLARFTRPRVESLEPWSAVMARFQARELDAAFGDPEYGWLADALLRFVTPETAEGYARGGVLTLDAALRSLARAVLDAPDFEIDAVLAASRTASASFSAHEALGPLMRAFAARNGALGELIADVVMSGNGADLLAMGVVARAVYGDGTYDGGVAAGRFEATCGNARIEPMVGVAMAARTEAIVRALFDSDRDAANEILAEADALATRVEAPRVGDSDLLTAGFAARLRKCADLVANVLTEPDGVTELLAALRPALDRANRHVEVERSNGDLRIAYARMAARLAAWLSTSDSRHADAGFADACRVYVDDGAWVDRARRRLWYGDSDAAISEIYRTVVDRVVERRADGNKQFAELLAGWTVTPDDAPLSRAGLVSVEQIVPTIVGPLAKTVPVLFIVLDGCGLPTFVELAEQFATEGFREVAPDDNDRRSVGVAALPTVTEVSRASLLAGRLDTGGQEHERRQFAGNAALEIDGRKALLFHQNVLKGPAGQALAAPVVTALNPEGPSVVGAVVNTIDDQLKRGVFASEYRVRDLEVLHWLLEAARTAGRVVVISADHGHVLAQPLEGGAGEFAGGGAGGERWRVADRSTEVGEVLLRGPRVLLGDEPGIIAPWVDDYRYGAKAGGYHGGATPEEVLVPVAVLVPAGLEPPKGWDFADEVAPLWWDVRVPVGEDNAIANPPVAKPRRRTSTRPGPEQGSMFDADRHVGQLARNSEPPWIDRLLGSEVWKAQRGAAGRARLDEARVRNVLSVLHRRGGVAPFPALTAGAEIPASRLDGFLAVLARVLNVDGYVALDVDVRAREVRLEVAILAQQFEIEIP